MCLRLFTQSLLRKKISDSSSKLFLRFARQTRTRSRGNRRWETRSVCFWTFPCLRECVRLYGACACANTQTRNWLITNTCSSIVRVGCSFNRKKWWCCAPTNCCLFIPKSPDFIAFLDRAVHEIIPKYSKNKAPSGKTRFQINFSLYDFSSTLNPDECASALWPKILRKLTSGSSNLTETITFPLFRVLLLLL